MLAGERAGGSPRTADKRAERAGRILAAAATLVLRWGYDKTTVDDIARQARVAKGTIYLHWKTREELFAALLQREGLALADDFLHQVAADPEGATLRGIYKYTALALLKRPLLKALLLRDVDVLGRLASAEHASAASTAKLAGFHVYLEFLRQRGLVRTDLSPRAQIYTVSAILTGFLVVEPLLPPSYALGDEELAELIGETVHRTLESGRALSPDEAAELSRAFLDYVNLALAAAGSPPASAAG